MNEVYTHKIAVNLSAQLNYSLLLFSECWIFAMTYYDRQLA